MSRLRLILRILFWDGVKPGENWAQTLVRVAGNLVRTLITLSVLFGLSLVGIYWVQALPDQTDRALASVMVDINYDPEICTSDQPVRIALLNQSDVSVTNLTMQVQARQPNFSNSALNGYSWDHRRTLNVIMRPGEGWRLCTNFPVVSGFAPNELVWSATLESGEIWSDE